MHSVFLFLTGKKCLCLIFNNNKEDKTPFFS